MFRLPDWLQRYRELPRCVFVLAAGNFLVNLNQTTLFLLLNLFLKKQHLTDPAIAALSGQRFVAPFFLAVPVGLWLRGRRLRGPMTLGAALFPVATVAAVETARCGWMTASSWCFLGMGVVGLLSGVAGMPLVLRMIPEHKVSEAFSLLFATWAAAGICGGLLSSVLQKIGMLQLAGFAVVLDERAVILLLAVVGLGAPWCFARLPDPPAPGGDGPRRWWLKVPRSEVGVLLRVLAPTLCIATGAGLSIQFLNLFFHTVHQVPAASYSDYNTATSLLVLAAGLGVPVVKRRFGWRGAIIGVQGVAVLLLVVMGLTELWAAATWALPLAVVCFILRQPLMSMAGPAISELTMSYVGENNRELVSACNGAIWSGAWWLAACVFQTLRGAHLPYWTVFLTTGALYAVGTLLYLGIIRAMDRRTPAASAEPALDAGLAS